MGLIVVCFAEAGSRRSDRRTVRLRRDRIRPLRRFLAGVVFWIECSFATAALATVFAANAGQLAPMAGGRLGSAVFLVAVFIALSALHVSG